MPGMVERTLVRPPSILGLLCLSGFFSGSETALTAASRGKLRLRADKGSTGASAALELKEDSERLIGALLLGNNFVNIRRSGDGHSASHAAVWRGRRGTGDTDHDLHGADLLEVLPKTLAITRPEAVASFVAPVVRIVTLVFAPIVTVCGRSCGACSMSRRPHRPRRTCPVDPRGDRGRARARPIGGGVEKEDRDRLLGALDLGHRTVEEIMRHRSQIEMIDIEGGPEAILSQALASPHTRLPLYKGEKENIVGVIHAKDLLRAVDKLVRGEEGSTTTLSDLDVMSVAMKPYFIPDTTPLDDQMRQFLKRHTHFALVVDEYGAIRGLITLEDILEEIVGEITDEFDVTQAPTFQRAEDGSYTVDGATTIRDLNRALDWSLPDEEANTVAGLVIHEAQMIPSEGQVFSSTASASRCWRKDNRMTRLKIRPL
jgi:Mg2+/Co2+ transporter CorB